MMPAGRTRLAPLALTLAALVAVASAASCGKTVTVKAGDTCYALWTAAKLTEKQFMALNPGVQCARLKIGDKLCLAPGTSGPARRPPPPRSVRGDDCSKTHTLKPGDSCAKLTATYGISESDFLAWNPTIECSKIYLAYGKVVCVGKGGSSGSDGAPPPPSDTTDYSPPPPSDTTDYSPPPPSGGDGGSCSKTVTIKQGDTCFALWTAAKLSSADFYKLNPNIDCAALGVGDSVCVAGGGSGGDGAPPPPSDTTDYSPPPPSGGDSGGSCSKTVTIKQGDTCFALWTAAKLTSADFYKLNPNIDCAALGVGDSVCVGGSTSGGKKAPPPPGGRKALPPPPASKKASPPPPGKASGACSKTVTVKSGDTCWAIWTTAKLTGSAFYALNPGIQCETLSVGDKVCVGK